MNSNYERGYILVRSTRADDIESGIKLLTNEAARNDYNHDELHYNIALGLFRTYRNKSLRNLLHESDDSRIKKLIEIANIEDMNGLSSQNKALRFFSGGLLILSAAGILLR